MHQEEVQGTVREDSINVPLYTVYCNVKATHIVYPSNKSLNQTKLYQSSFIYSEILWIETLT